MKRISLMVVLLGVLLLLPAPCLAEVWMDIPGYIIFDGDDGSVQSRDFTSWYSLKLDPFYLRNKSGVDVAGYFSFTDSNESKVMHVLDAKRYDMDGIKTPIVITYQDGTTREVQVNRSFIYAICRTREFKFMGEDPVAKDEVEYDVPAESVKTLIFYQLPE